MMKNTGIIIQARMGSTRLPGKIFKTILGQPLIKFELDRLKRVRFADSIVIATTEDPKDQVIENFCKQEHAAIFRGKEEDVLNRYLEAAKAYRIDTIIRVSGDCPLIDPKLIDQGIEMFKAQWPNIDYLSNTLFRTYPRGLDFEIFSLSTLEKAQEFTSIEEREHVTPGIWKHPEVFRLKNIVYEKDLSSLRWTVDTSEDFTLIQKILENLYPKKPDFEMEDVLSLLEEHPEWRQINAHIKQKGV